MALFIRVTVKNTTESSLIKKVTWAVYGKEGGSNRKIPEMVNKS